jgi:hypothetical protein
VGIMKKHAVVLSFFVLSLAACSGNHTQSLPTSQTNEAAVPAGITRLHKTPKPTPFPNSIYTPLPPDTNVQRSVMPTPFDPSLPLTRLGTTDLVNRISSLAVPHRRSTQSFALAPENDHESEGVFLFGNAPPYNALFATQTAYEAVQDPVPFPPGASGAEQIFAPTMHPAWGSCLESSSFYISSPAGETAHFTVFNFCLASASFIFDATIDSTFLRDYVRYTDGDFPSYVSEIFTPDTVPSPTSTWYSVLYNFHRHRYDIITSVNANGLFQADAFGWSIVEPYDAQGTCPRIAPALVSHLSAYNTARDGWDAVTPFMDGGAYTFIGVQAGSTNSCLLGDATGAASIDFTLITENSAWEATSPRTDP